MAGIKPKEFFTVVGRCACGQTPAIAADVNGKRYVVSICKQCGYDDSGVYNLNEVVQIY